MGAYVYNGDQPHKNGKDYTQDYGLWLDYTKNNFSVHYAFTNNFLNADKLTDINEDGVADQIYSGNLVSGSTVATTFSYESVTIIGEYFISGKFDKIDKTFNSRTAQISGYNIEVLYDYYRSFKFGLSTQGTEQAVSYGLTKRKTLFLFAKTLEENSVLKFEFEKSQDYPSSSGGTGEEVHKVTVQWAVSF